jgi:hypothetical protein
MNFRRIIIATVLGIISGFVCASLASSNGANPLPWALTVSIILGRTLLGFGIGISNWKMAWWLHGIVMGVVFSLPMAFSVLISSPFAIFIATIAMGVVYGVLIELVTSVIFKAKQS